MWGNEYELIVIIISQYIYIKSLCFDYNEQIMMTEKQHGNSCKDIQKRSEFFNSLVIWFSTEWVLGGEAWISIAEKIFSHVQTGSYKHIITELHQKILLLVCPFPISHEGYIKLSPASMCSPYLNLSPLQIDAFTTSLRNAPDVNSNVLLSSYNFFSYLSIFCFYPPVWENKMPSCSGLNRS